jgi:hypothetical protein
VRSSVLLILLVGTLSGCARHGRCAKLEATPRRAAPANLALGPTVETNRLAASLPDRTDWPAVENGYRVDDTTYYFSDSYDAQYFFDRFGSLYRADQSIRSAVRIR